jgi:ABC-type ATPase with predicted acetyltransferase domain
MSRWTIFRDRKYNIPDWMYWATFYSEQRWCGDKIEWNKNPQKKAQRGKIENVAGSVWLSLFMDVPVLSSANYRPRPLAPC